MKEIFGSSGSPVAGPPAPAALAAKVRTLAPSMTRSMQRVAEAVAGDPAGCAALTVTGLAELTGTSEATVVRTARLLGYPGYRDQPRAPARRRRAHPTGAGPPRT
ncbi:MurR/RpiR family transcriptional regulator, partial [Streptomyces sp. NPDC059378]|uniref:MurR/RpiR family transcriptional regulator n=1 Tax=Streptomyces sp. NPDC059378 TaxID=3346815 RepID=UPI0036A31BD5